ncbi:hypothetical protein BD413DRAFT_527872 [Trametes elegans]|nr:hypothetical protein BD413DRAFT_527872 [Trametes elegans]
MPKSTVCCYALHGHRRASVSRPSGPCSLSRRVLRRRTADRCLPSLAQLRGTPVAPCLAGTADAPRAPALRTPPRVPRGPWDRISTYEAGARASHEATKPLLAPTRTIYSGLSTVNRGLPNTVPRRDSARYNVHVFRTSLARTSRPRTTWIAGARAGLVWTSRVPHLRRVIPVPSAVLYPSRTRLSLYSAPARPRAQ